MKLDWEHAKCTRDNNKKFDYYSLRVGGVSLTIYQYSYTSKKEWAVVARYGQRDEFRVVGGTVNQAEKAAIELLTAICDEREQQVRDIRALLSGVS